MSKRSVKSTAKAMQQQDEAEWELPDDSPVVQKKKQKRNSSKRAFTLNTTNNGTSLLEDNKELIFALHAKGTKPKDIAEAVLSTKKLQSGITGKQISDFIYYRKKSGQIKTFPVSPGNDNLRANRGDSCMWLWPSSSSVDALGYDEAQDLANNYDGEAEAERIEDDVSSDVMSETEYASKYFRFFQLSGLDDYFAIAVECGLERDIRCEADMDLRRVKLNVKLPVPPDAMVQAAGYHAVENTLVGLEEEFYFPTPREISTTHRPETIFYPNPETPLWVIFKFRLAEFVIPEQMKADIHLVDVLLNSRKDGEKK